MEKMYHTSLVPTSHKQAVVAPVPRTFACAPRGTTARLSLKRKKLLRTWPAGLSGIHVRPRPSKYYKRVRAEARGGSTRGPGGPGPTRPRPAGAYLVLMFWLSHVSPGSPPQRAVEGAAVHRQSPWPERREPRGSGGAGRTFQQAVAGRRTGGLHEKDARVLELVELELLGNLLRRHGWSHIPGAAPAPRPRPGAPRARARQPRRPTPPVRPSARPHAPCGRSCLFAKTRRTASFMSRSPRMRWSSCRASSMRARSSLSTTKIRPCVPV